ncbi:MAG: NAD+ synthase [Melioribacter sp.]|nr:NAD+ synthase [Melioribacter sp.]
MKIAVCQSNPIIGDLKGNKEKILEGYRKSINQGADLVVFPELFLCGYPPLDLVEKKEFREKVISTANEIASQTNSVGLLFGSITEDYEDKIGTNVYNSALLCYDGKIQFVQSKTLIPNYDVFDEVRYFESAKEINVHKFGNEKLGISICEDIWNDADYWKHRRYPVDPIKMQINKGATLLINISASPYAYGKRKERYQMLSVLTKDDKIPLAYICCVGAQTELIFDGGSMCFNSRGELCLLGKSFQEDYLIFDTNEKYQPVQEVESCFEEEVLSALIMALKDYGAKTGFSKAIIGLSGGIDSALVVYIAERAFGKENVVAVMMPSQFSSNGSVEDSIKLIAKLGIKSHKISIQSVFNEVLNVLEPAFNKMPQDITEENLQSRIRGMYLMALSNKHGYLLCATGNKSELATGYATLYGDMSGALAVIGDIYKTQVYNLAKHINRNEEIIPDAIIEKVPSAELRPNQTDQDSLPPYDLLDGILKMYLEDQKEYNEIVNEIGQPEIVSKVLRMVDMNEFKRKQAPPVLRVSTKAFGYGRRYPIVQRWRK